jgi:biopolymer transport protein ExbD
VGADHPDWVAIENHPALAEVAADLEAPPPRHYDDETRLDMNALIDVTLVLLIFFILTTSYATLQKLLDSPNLKVDQETGLPVKSPQEVKQFMIHVKVTMENDQPVIRVEGQVVDEDSLVSALAAFTTGDKRKTDLLIEADLDVPRQTIVTIQDKAKAAKIQKVYRLVPKEK